MEDRIHVECVWKDDGSFDYLFAGVYDGHGGAQASEYARENLLENIRSTKGFDSDCDEEILKAIKSGFIKTHDSMLKVSETWPRTASGYSCTAGTTASCVFIRNGKIYVGHVGDSSVILGYSDSDNKEDSLRAKQLTVDHKPDNENELSRIQFAGGCVLPKSGISRVIRGHFGPIRRSTPTEQIPFLAIARSLGDFWSYNNITEEFVVSPVPDVSVHKLTSTDKCIFVVSDGVSNVMPSSSIMKSLHKYVNEPKGEDSLINMYINPAHCVLKSVLESWSILRADNISIACIMLEPIDDKLLSKNVNTSKKNVNMCIDSELTKNPTAMIKVSKDSINSFPTQPVKLFYRGSVDKETTPVNYSGPGYVKCIHVGDKREPESIEDDDEIPFTKRRRILLGDNNQEVPIVSDDELEVTYEEEDEREYESPQLSSSFSPYRYVKGSHRYCSFDESIDYDPQNCEYEAHEENSSIRAMYEEGQNNIEWTPLENQHIEFEDFAYNNKNNQLVKKETIQPTINIDYSVLNSQPSTSTSTNFNTSLCPSTLSPVAMLRAMRASNEDIRRKSIIQIVRSKYIQTAALNRQITSKPFIRRKAPQKRPTTDEESFESEFSAEPPSKRSRLWNFITNMVRITPKMYKLN